MDKIGERIRKKRESLHMSQDELAEKVGYKSRSSINKIEVDGRSVPANKLKDIADALFTTPAYLMGWEEDPIVIKESFIQIPLYQSISCGTGAFVDENIEEYVSIPSRMLRKGKQYFANYAQGDSMINQNINDGDLVIFERCNSIENGQIGTFSLDGEEATCKIFKKDPRSGLIMLLPANNKYDPIPIDKDNHNFRVIGKLALVINNRQDA